MSTFVERLNDIQNKIKSSCLRVGRSPSEVKLLAVSKFQSTQLIIEAYECGLRDFGENYVQELYEKKQKLSHLKDIRWHLIGELQKNKIKHAIVSADVFQALDSEKTLLEIKKRAEGKCWPVFVEVNIDEEPQKGGLLAHEVPVFIERVKCISEVKLLGLMTIPSIQHTDESKRKAFQKMRMLRDSIDKNLKLSMGMSDDFEIAIEEGSDLVRIGTKLFGTRARS